MKSKPDAIFCADLHLREDKPKCYVGDFRNDQFDDLRFIQNLQMQYGCPVICSGDVFDYWKPSPELLSDTIKSIPDEFIAVYGNHDLPQHNLDLRHKCGMYTLIQSGHISNTAGAKKYKNFTVFGASWGMEPPTTNLSDGINILVWHKLTFHKESPYPGCEEPNAKSLLKQYPMYDVIVTGDNHQAFTESFKGRLLVNPGSMNRQTAAQMDFEPRVYLWYADTNTVEPVYIPLKEDVISREHLDKIELRDGRLAAYITKLDSEFELGVVYEDNVRTFCNVNKVHKSIVDIIEQSFETNFKV